MSKNCSRKLEGSFKARVTNVQDPTKQGRIKVEVPCLAKGDIGWCLPKHDMDEDFRIPGIGKLVWVEFQDCKVEMPLWSYGWPKKDSLNELAENFYPTNKTRGARVIGWGDMVIFMLSEDGNHRIEIRDFNDTSAIRLNTDEDTKIELESDGDISIKCDGTLRFEYGNLEMESDGNDIKTAGGDYKRESLGNTEFNSAKKIKLISQSDAQIRAGIQKDIELMSGTTEADEYGLKGTKTQNTLKHPVKNVVKSPQITLDAKTGVKIGSDTATEAAVLGTTLNQFFGDLIIWLSAHQHLSSMPGSPTPVMPNDIASILQKNSDLIKHVSKKNKVD